VLITGVLSILGAWVAVVSYRWYRQRELRYPLAILTGTLSVGLFHRFAQQFDPTMPVSIVALIVVIMVVVPVKGVLYVLQPQSDT
jgi:predicted membrane channel-forming protein YqfA (hemolysin III family)